MLTLTENELVFEFAGTTMASKFDDQQHRLSRCMKAVDFVVEYDDHDLLVEVKDPDQTGATPERKARFVEKLQGDELVRDLARKYRDSWIYRWSHDHDEPVRYVVLLQLSTLSDVMLLSLTDRLRHELPALGPGGAPWPRPFVLGASVLNMQSWNRLGRYGTVRRVPAPAPAP